jgi:hypothetical protein
VNEDTKPNISRLDDVELMVRYDSVEDRDGSDYAREPKSEVKNRGVLMPMSSRSGASRLELVLGRLTQEQLNAILESVTQPEHVSNVGLQGAVLVEIERREAGRKLIAAARARAKSSVPFNGGLYLVPANAGRDSPRSAQAHCRHLSCDDAH